MANTSQLSDKHADLNIACDGVSGCIGSFMRIKQTFPHLKFILSIGGGGPASAPFPSIAADAIKRDKFALSARSLIDASGFDGIDSKQTFEIPKERANHT